MIKMLLEQHKSYKEEISILTQENIGLRKENQILRNVNESMFNDSPHRHRHASHVSLLPGDNSPVGSPLNTTTDEIVYTDLTQYLQGIVVWLETVKE